jgi:hypothetical protein
MNAETGFLTKTSRDKTPVQNKGRDRDYGSRMKNVSGGSGGNRGNLRHQIEDILDEDAREFDAYITELVGADDF